MHSKQNNVYRYKCDDLILPSVSTILKSDPKFKQAQKSRGFSNSRPGSARNQFSAERGSAVHSAARKFIRTGEVDLAAKYFPYWEGIHKQLTLLDLTDVEWAEGPVPPELKHLQQGEHSAVWNSKQMYVGCPDLVANVGGLRALVEFKTSDEMFMSTYDMDFKNYSNWWRYHQASMQTASYVKAYEQTTKHTIDVGLIVVATRDDSQLFILEQPQLKTALTKFHKLAKEFHMADNFTQPIQTSSRKLQAVVV